MVANVRDPDVLAEVVYRVLSVGATEFEVESEDGKEQVAAFNGAVGVGVMAFRADSEDGRELRSQLYALKKKRRAITCAGVRYRLQVKMFDSFGENAFRVRIARS